MVANENGNILGWGEDWCIKTGRVLKQKGNDYTISRCQIVKKPIDY